ncbi:MAG: fibro-slime domain-containing protein [Crocosphaera sp.]
MTENKNYAFKEAEGNICFFCQCETPKLVLYYSTTTQSQVLPTKNESKIMKKQTWSLNFSMKKIGLKIAISTMGLGLISLGTSSKVEAATIDITGTIRDFCFLEIAGVCSDHPDFEQSVGGLETGIVESTIGLDRKPVYAKGDGTSSITTNGATFFDQWYRDVPGVNASTPLTITLDNTITADPDVFTFVEPQFFPIDGKLFGNQGLIHNYHYTYEIKSKFTYKGGEIFSFTGDDDVWVFINDELVVDLGGVHPPLSATVDLDTLGLTIGEDYNFDLFFAERQTTGSSFRIDTSIVLEDLESVPEPSSLGFITLAGLSIASKLYKTQIEKLNNRIR